MTFDPQTIFANLVEKERVHGHHSPEGRAIRTLCRALNGRSAGDLSAHDVWAMCDQAIEEWLKARLKISQWSAQSRADLLAQAMASNFISVPEAHRLQDIHDACLRPTTGSVPDVEAALEFCIQIVEKHWE